MCTCKNPRPLSFQDVNVLLLSLLATHSDSTASVLVVFSEDEEAVHATDDSISAQVLREGVGARRGGSEEEDGVRRRGWERGGGWDEEERVGWGGEEDGVRRGGVRCVMKERGEVE
jgi:hypothetical protein